MNAQIGILRPSSCETTVYDALETIFSRGAATLVPPFSGFKGGGGEIKNRGCGNDAPMEITKRFPQELANLAEEREIRTFPQADSSVFHVERT